jgi:hypothetical protein
MTKYSSALVTIAIDASADFEGLSYVDRKQIDKLNISNVPTNGISINCGDLTRGKKSFTFSIWLDQLVKCHGDQKEQKYFWYGVFTSSESALKDLIEALPLRFKPAKILHRDGPGHFALEDLIKVKKAANGSFKQFRDELPKGFLGKIVEERYSEACLLGCFAKCDSLDDASKRHISKKIRMLWHILADAAVRSSKQGTASTTKKYNVRKLTQNYEVFPSHTTLQSGFEKWIEKVQPGRFEIKHDANLVDICLREIRTDRITLVEVKPGNASNVRHAAREAIGQLFQYRFEYLPSGQVPQLAVVLGTKPDKRTSSLLESLDINLFCKAGKSFKGAFVKQPKVASGNKP